MLPIFKYNKEICTWDNRKFDIEDIKQKIECPLNIFADKTNVAIDKCTLCRSCLNSGI